MAPISDAAAGGLSTIVATPSAGCGGPAVLASRATAAPRSARRSRSHSERPLANAWLLRPSVSNSIHRDTPLTWYEPATPVLLVIDRRPWLSTQSIRCTRTGGAAASVISPSTPATLAGSSCRSAVVVPSAAGWHRPDTTGTGSSLRGGSRYPALPRLAAAASRARPTSVSTPAGSSAEL